MTPALISYDGIQYTYMAPAIFEDGQHEYVKDHLRILSGFYGVLKPMDGVVPYRLEMQAKATVAGNKDLYEFWGNTLYIEVIDESRTIINLASKEYSKCIGKYLQPKGHYVTCVFGELDDGKVVQKGVYAKMARGEMVRFMSSMLIELRTFVENLTCDCVFTTHHTIAANLTGPDFLKRKDRIIAALTYAIEHGDMDRMAAIRRNKRSL